MVVASLLFACMGVCVKLAADRYTAVEIVFYRSVVSLCLMVALVRLQGVAVRTPHLQLQVIRGLAGFVSLMLYFYAITRLPLATAVTLNYTSPLFLAGFMTFSRSWQLRRGVVGALLMGFVGVVLLLRPTLSADQWASGLIGLASGFMAGLAYFNVRELGARGEPESRTVFYFALVSTIGAASWMATDEFHAIDMRGAALLLGVGMFATLAQMAMTRSYKRGKAALSANLAFTAVIFASLFGMLIWDERTSLPGWLAMALIVASGMVASQASRANPAEQD